MNDRLRLTLFTLSAGVLLANLVPLTALFRGLFDGGLTPSLVDRDFVNYWMGSKLALGREHPDLFNQQDYFARLEQVFGPQRQVRAWSYPPHILLPLFPLALLPYEIAFTLFLLLTFVLFVAGAEALRKAEAPEADRKIVGAVIIAYATINLNAGQNGFLTGALLLFGLAFRGKRPVLAGLAFGLLTVKPQLGLLVPLLLLVERDWATILWSAVFALGLVALSAVIFGSGAWHAYLTVTSVEQQSVLTDWSGIFIYMMPTVFGALRSLGADPSLAAAVQWPVSIVVVAMAVWLFLNDRCRLGRTFTLLCATFLVSPYAFDYDMGALVVAAAIILASRSGLDRASSAVLTAVAVLPAFVLPLGYIGAPVASVVLAAALFVVIRRVSASRKPLPPANHDSSLDDGQAAMVVGRGDHGKDDDPG